MADNVIGKNINNYPNYFINELGEVTNVKTGNKLKNYLGKTGYYVVNLYNDKGKKLTYVHRILAEAYLNKVLDKNHINHKNGIKSDNRLENLEWVNHSENIKHSYNTGLSNSTKIANSIKQSKVVLDLQTGIFYESAKEAAKLLGINSNTLRCYLNNYYPNKTNLKYV